MANINIPNTVTTIRNGAFTGCHSLANVVLPNGLTAISKRMFSHCSGLKSIDIPASVTYIGEGAFKACSSLTDVNIPDSSPTIEAWAFCDCSSLEHITIPSSVTAIPIYTFAGCTALMHVTSLSTTPPEADSDYSFDHSVYPSAVLSVPASAISDYRTADGWNKFALVEDLDRTIPGDVNKDTEVNVSDINAVINCILNTDTDMPTADVNQDGEVNISDINSVIDLILNPNTEDGSLQVWESDGNKSSFALTDMPKMTCVGDSLIITTAKNKFCFELNSIYRITYTKDNGKRDAPCTVSAGLPGLNIRHMTIHLKGGDYKSFYLDNLNGISTSGRDGNSELQDNNIYQCVDSRNGRHYYAVNEIDSITFGSTNQILPQTHNHIPINHLVATDIMPDIWNLEEVLHVADISRVADMMWEHGAGDYSIAQYRHLMDRLCNVMKNETPNDFEDFEFIGKSYEGSNNYNANREMFILKTILKHSHLCVCMGGDSESGPYYNHSDLYIGKYANEHPDKIFIAGYGTNILDYYPIWGWGYSSSNGFYADVRESYKSENIMIFSKLREAHYDLGNEHIQYENNINSYWLPLANNRHDNIVDCHMLYSFGIGNNSFLDVNSQNSQTCFPVNLHKDAVFSGRNFSFRYYGSTGTSSPGSNPALPTYLNVALASLCFQMKADVKNVDELLYMIRATSLTDTVQRYDVVQPLHLINPAGFFQRYLMPQSLPETVGEGPYARLEKGFYKGVIFDIPGAEVNIDGEWITASAANEGRIKAQDPFSLEWRLNVPKLLSMGYGNNDEVTGHVIVVDDQFSGLNIEKEFKVLVSINN